VDTAGSPKNPSSLKIEALSSPEEFRHPEGGHGRVTEESFFLKERGIKFLRRILLL
jgi:hypothetical protein